MAITGLSTSVLELKVAFEQAQGERGTYENRWEDYSGWTIPHLYPDDNLAEGTEFQHDYQSLGAQAVNHLSNKIVMTLFAPARPFFRLELTQEQKRELRGRGISSADIETLTGTVEKEAMRNMEKVRLRTSVITAVKHLITLGNSLLYFPDKEGDALKNSQVYSLRDYIVRRDLSGNVLQIITKDRRVCRTLPEELRLQCEVKGHKEEDKIDLYTGITRREDGKFFVKQELGEVGIASTDFGIIPAADLPWVPLTWNLTRGEDYGVGLVEEFAGDFSVYSQLSESVLNLASLAADIKILVNPMGQTDVKTLNESEAGTYVHGLETDISYLQLEKLADFKFVQETMADYSRRIGAAFLLNTQVTRDAERVTAEEIRLQANELESSLGGVYSRLAEEMQQPLARMLIGTVNSALKDIEPTVLTGIESLSRNSEHEQMMLFLNDLTIFNNVPDDMKSEIKLSDMAKILATNRGIEHDKFLKTTEEKNAEQEAAKAQAADAEMQMAAGQAAGEQVGSPQTIA